MVGGGDGNERINYGDHGGGPSTLHIFALVKSRRRNWKSHDFSLPDFESVRYAFQDFSPNGGQLSVM